MKEEPIILYVEDEEMDRFLMQRAFEKTGRGGLLRVVRDGQEAIDYLSGADPFTDRSQFPVPGLVLLDINLPGLSGFEVLEWLRAHRSYALLPVVIFSSSERDDDRVRARELGANEFIKKPGSGIAFQQVVQTLFEQWLSPATSAPLPPPSTTVLPGATPPPPSPPGRLV